MPIRICVIYGNKLKIKPDITVRISIQLSVSVVQKSINKFFKL